MPCPPDSRAGNSGVAEVPRPVQRRGQLVRGALAVPAIPRDAYRYQNGFELIGKALLRWDQELAAGRDGLVNFTSGKAHGYEREKA